MKKFTKYFLDNVDIVLNSNTFLIPLKLNFKDLKSTQELLMNFISTGD